MFFYSLKSDYLAVYGGWSISQVIKSIFNPSMHANFLIRMLSIFESKLWHVVIRNILIAKHGIDVGYNVKIGLGLRLPHPTGIVIGDGVVIGNNVSIYQCCTLGGKNGYPVVGDKVVIYPNTVVVGGVTLGTGSVVGACTFLDRDLSDGEVFYSGSKSPIKGSGGD